MVTEVVSEEVEMGFQMVSPQPGVEPISVPVPGPDVDQKIILPPGVKIDPLHKRSGLEEDDVLALWERVAVKPAHSRKHNNELKGLSTMLASDFLSMSYSQIRELLDPKFLKDSNKSIKKVYANIKQTKNS